MRPEQIAGDMRKFQEANMRMEMTDEMSMYCLFDQGPFQIQISSTNFL